jgi:hypothetical protein
MAHSPSIDDYSRQEKLQASKGRLSGKFITLQENSFSLYHFAMVCQGRNALAIPQFLQALPDLGVMAALSES